jgi:hypothetical protein
VGTSCNLTSGPIFVETHCEIEVFRPIGTAWQKGAAAYSSCRGWGGVLAAAAGAGGGYAQRRSRERHHQPQIHGHKRLIATNREPQSSFIIKPQN